MEAPKTVRVSGDLYVKIRKAAEKEQRSITNMVNVLLAQALDHNKNTK